MNSRFVRLYQNRTGSQSILTLPSSKERVIQTARLVPLSCFIILALSGMILSGCKYSYKEETINVKNEFSMTVPDYLTKADNLKPGADFQYSNRFRNTYVVVFSDKKEKGFQSYYHDQMAVIKQALDKPMVNDSDAIEIPGAKGIHTEIAGRMQGELIYYSILTLEAKDKYYQACIWSRGEERKLKYGKDMEKILFSFKLLNP